MTRVVATFNERRNIVEISKIVGNAEKSKGFVIHSATMRMSTENASDKAKPKSINTTGMGRNRMLRMKTIPKAKLTSVEFCGLGVSADAGMFMEGMSCCAQSVASS